MSPATCQMHGPRVACLLDPDSRVFTPNHGKNRTGRDAPLVEVPSASPPERPGAAGETRWKHSRVPTIQVAGPLHSLEPLGN